MVPLRRLLIVQAHDELPYPEGTACAEVLRATVREDGRATSASAWIFRGMAVGAAVKLLISLAYLIPGELSAALPVLPKAELALEDRARRCSAWATSSATGSRRCASRARSSPRSRSRR